MDLRRAGAEGGATVDLPWAVEARRNTADLDLAVLRALQPDDVYSPDFIHPPPTSPLAEIEDELSVMLATPAEQVRAEVRDSYRDRALPPALEPFIDDPADAVASLAELVREYWDRTLASHWPRLRALLDGDILYRAQATVDPGERGLLFVPSVFVWPAVLLITATPWQPTLIYPARGVGTLWEPGAPRPPGALAALLGRSRAIVLLALDRPRTTTDLARALGLSAGGASQQLAVLRDAGLVHGHRVGRVVLYLRTPAGDDLLAAAGPAIPRMCE